MRGGEVGLVTGGKEFKFDTQTAEHPAPGRGELRPAQIGPGSLAAGLRALRSAPEGLGPTPVPSGPHLAVHLVLTLSRRYRPAPPGRAEGA